MKQFKQELLNSLKNYSFPHNIQKLIDNGIVQECEMIDNIYYLLFSFYLEKQTFYNYNSRVYTDFVFSEIVDVIYAGGLAVDSKGKILKGIINPFYLKIHTADEDNIFNVDYTKATPYIVGVPQVFNKKDNLKLRDLFISNNCCRVFNLSTNRSNTWSSFLLHKESYENTSYGVTYGVSSYYGELYDEDGQLIELKHYFGQLVEEDESVPFQFVQDKLKNNTLLSSITKKLVCNPNKGLNEVAKAYKDGMKEISNSIDKAGVNIRIGTSNIANSLNQSPDVVWYN